MTTDVGTRLPLPPPHAAYELVRSAVASWADVLPAQYRRQLVDATPYRHTGLGCVLPLRLGAEHTAWLKVVPPALAQEVTATATVSRLVPGVCPPVLGTGQNWILLADAGSPPPEDAAILQGDLRRLIGDLHTRTGDLAATLAEPTFPRRSLTSVSGVLRRLIDDDGVAGLPAPVAGRLTRCHHAVEEMLAEVATWGVPEVLLHGDIHPGNWCRGADGARLIDWSDVCVGPAVFDLAHVVDTARSAGRPGRVARQYQRVFPYLPDLTDRSTRLLGAVTAAFQVETQHRLLADVEASFVHVRSLEYWIDVLVGWATGTEPA